MTVRDIVREYLAAHGYDGLCNADTECGCGGTGLFLCEGDDPAVLGCEPAYIVPCRADVCGNSCDDVDNCESGYCYSTRKPETTREEESRE